MPKIFSMKQINGLSLAINMNGIWVEDFVESEPKHTWLAMSVEENWRHDDYIFTLHSWYVGNRVSTTILSRIKQRWSSPYQGVAWVSMQWPIHSFFFFFFFLTPPLKCLLCIQRPLWWKKGSLILLREECEKETSQGYGSWVLSSGPDRRGYYTPCS